MFTLVRKAGVWYLNGIATESFQKALEVVFSTLR